jgi:hypothetical protein
MTRKAQFPSDLCTAGGGGRPAEAPVSLIRAEGQMLGLKISDQSHGG